MRAPTCFRWVHFRNVGWFSFAANHHYSPYGFPPASRQAIDNIPISGKRVIIAACNYMHPLGRVLWFGYALCAWRSSDLFLRRLAVLDSWLHPRATYRTYAWQRRPLSRPSSRCPWSSAWQLSSMPSTILLSAASTPSPSRVWAERRCFGPGRRLHCANPRHLVPRLATRPGAAPAPSH